MRLIRTVIIAASAVLAAAGESLPPDGVPPPPAGAVAADAQRLVERLGSPATVVLRDGGRAWWQASSAADDPAYAIIDTDAAGDVRIETPIGALTVSRALVAEGRADALRALPRLLARAAAAKLSADGFRLREGVLTGLHLNGPERLVLAEGVLAKAAAEPRPAGELAALEAAIAGVRPALAATPLDDIARRAVEEVLSRLTRKDADIDEDIEDVVPSFARRVIRAGWLRGIVGEAAAPVEAAVRAVDRHQPTLRYDGSDDAGRPLRLHEVKDAFGGGGWILATPERSAYTRVHPQPLYYRAMPDLRLVVDLPPGADPAHPGGAQPIAARLVDANGLVEIARWSASGGFATDAARWRRSVPAAGRNGIAKSSVADVMPPHIVLAGLDGDLAGIAVPGGVLTPPRPGEPASRFIDAASELLLRDPAQPDAAYLALIGEYMFMYVHDSPDPRFPLLLGNRKDKGDIHQTAEQTLATVTGGMLRGDCDDLSELYQVIAQRQGLLAYVINLPQHAAACWASRDPADGRWHVFVLQTGPALEFSDPQLPKALELAYKRFDETDAFDPNGLGLLLRFSGENTRSQWRLSWKIFVDQDYANLMIDVQRDWHYQTYQRGIGTMLGLVAKEEAANGAGKADTANYRELSGLYSFTGQHREAVEMHRKAIAATPASEPLSRFYMAQELVSHQLDAGLGDEAARTVAAMLDQDLPRLRGELGSSALQVGIGMANVLARHGRTELAVRSLDQLVNRTPLPSLFSREQQPIGAQIEALAGWIRSPDYNPQIWERSDGLRHLRNVMQMYVGASIAVLAAADRRAPRPAEAVQVAARAVQRWLDDIAFRDAEEPGDVLMRYAAAGRYYAAVLGDEALARLLDGVRLPDPAAPAPDHAVRVGGLAQLPADLPWIAASVPYWADRLFDRFDQRAPLPADPAAWKTETLRLARRVADAAAFARQAGLDQPGFAHLSHLAQVVAAMIGQDAALLRERLDAVKDRNDKRLRDDTAQWMGDAARFCDLAWYGRAIDLWQERVDYKPKWFWIAWRAAVTGGEPAWPHALLVAERAAKRYADDPTFAEERDFMRKLLAQPAAGNKN